MPNLDNDENFLWYLDEDVTCVIGHIGSGKSDEETVIFLDGDASNHDEDNIINIDFFEGYSYSDFLDDFLFRDRLLGAVERLNKKLIEIRKIASSQVGTSATQSNNQKVEENPKM